MVSGWSPDQLQLARRCPHSPQNLAPVAILVPQDGHAPLAGWAAACGCDGPVWEMPAAVLGEIAGAVGAGCRAMGAEGEVAGVNVRRSAGSPTSSRAPLRMTRVTTIVPPISRRRMNTHILRSMLQQELVDGPGDAVLVVRGSDVQGLALHFVRGVAHGDTKAGEAEHADVRLGVAHGDRILRRNAQLS